jgi:hypothetical protein
VEVYDSFEEAMEESSEMMELKHIHLDKLEKFLKGNLKRVENGLKLELPAICQHISWKKSENWIEGLDV